MKYLIGLDACVFDDEAGCDGVGFLLLLALWPFRLLVISLRVEPMPVLSSHDFCWASEYLNLGVWGEKGGEKHLVVWLWKVWERKGFLLKRFLMALFAAIFPLLPLTSAKVEIIRYLWKFMLRQKDLWLQVNFLLTFSWLFQARSSVALAAFESFCDNFRCYHSMSVPCPPCCRTFYS